MKKERFLFVSIFLILVLSLSFVRSATWPGNITTKDLNYYPNGSVYIYPNGTVFTINLNSANDYAYVYYDGVNMLSSPNCANFSTSPALLYA
jgi:hypothetical protein